jgi:hypothetical protein
MSVEIAVTLHARDQQSDASASVATISPFIGLRAGSVNPDAITDSGEPGVSTNCWGTSARLLYGGCS